MPAGAPMSFGAKKVVDLGWAAVVEDLSEMMENARDDALRNSAYLIYPLPFCLLLHMLGRLLVSDDTFDRTYSY